MKNLVSLLHVLCHKAIHSGIIACKRNTYLFISDIQYTDSFKRGYRTIKIHVTDNEISSGESVKSSSFLFCKYCSHNSYPEL